jgi:hypothetical protein
MRLASSRCREGAKGPNFRREEPMKASIGKITVLIVLAITLVASPANAQVTFGAFLLAGLNKAQDLIRTAEQSGNILEIEAGIQVQNVITQAQIAYAQSLTDSIDKLDTERAKVKADIDNMLQNLAAKTDASIHNALTQAQLIANELPFSGKLPHFPNYLCSLPAMRSQRVTIGSIFKAIFHTGLMLITYHGYNLMVSLIFLACEAAGVTIGGYGSDSGPS